MSTTPRDPVSLAQLLATMGHELPTPMNGVPGMAELLNDTALTVEQREYIDGLTPSAYPLLRVVDDILDYSEIESGHLTLESAPSYLHRYIGDTLRVPIVALTARGDDRMCCLAAGMNDYPSKPVVPAEPSETLERVVTPFESHA